MSMTVAELLKDKALQASGSMLFSIAPGAPVSAAVSLMVQKSISSVLVLDGDTMLGLITLRELLAGLDTQGDHLLKTPCSKVMKANPPVARPEDSVDHLRGLMTELHITHVPVMNGGKLVGILSFQDIARSAIKDVAFENQLLKQYIKNWPA
ncbi:MAG TPA: CBS domain-containing protein [Usitatibacteraceae bacterium]